MSAVTVPMTARDFRQWIEPAVKTTDVDPRSGYGLPVFAHVRVTVREDHAIAASTDRFTASLSRVRYTPRVENTTADVMVAAADLKRIWTLFNATRGVNPPLVLTFTEDRLEVASDGHTFGVPTRTPESLNVPDILKLIREVVGHGFKSDEPFAIDPRRLAQVAHAPKGEPIILAKATGRTRPVIVRSGDDYLGLVMPVCITDGDAAPAPITAGWHDALGINPTKDDA